MDDFLLTGNPYFTAGFGLLGVGSALAVARQGVIRFAGFLQRKMVSTLEVTSRDPAYPWILQWMTRQPLSSGGHFSLSYSSPSVQKADGNCFQLVPSPGTHFFRWQGRWLQVSRERERSQMLMSPSSVNSFASGPFETLTLSCLAGSRIRAEKLISSILWEARAEAQRFEAGKLVIWTAFGQEWRPFGQPRRHRPLSSVILAAGVKDALLADVREFLSAETWYQQRGIPYRRGYLLEGPPGGGKSSLVQAVASELGYSICVLSLSEGWLTDDRFALLLNSLPPKSILLLEDIDATGPSRQVAAGVAAASSGRLSFSGLLNALDGVTCAEERIIFMTTNHCDRLDSALIRPGRVDYRQHVGWAEAAQAAQMFANFYPEHRHLAGEFGNLVREAVSPAAIQGHFIRFKNCPKEALDEAKQQLSLETKVEKETEQTK
jgi:chaperone BCS1